MIHISYRESPVAFYEAVENGFVHQMFLGCEVPVATELTAERSPVHLLAQSAEGTLVCT